MRSSRAEARAHASFARAARALCSAASSSAHPCKAVAERSIGCNSAVGRCSLRRKRPVSRATASRPALLRSSTQGPESRVVGGATLATVVTGDGRRSHRLVHAPAGRSRCGEVRPLVGLAGASCLEEAGLYQTVASGLRERPTGLRREGRRRLPRGSGRVLGCGRRLRSRRVGRAHLSARRRPGWLRSAAGRTRRTRRSRAAARASRCGPSRTSRATRRLATSAAASSGGAKQGGPQSSPPGSVVLAPGRVAAARGTLVAAERVDALALHRGANACPLPARLRARGLPSVSALLRLPARNAQGADRVLVIGVPPGTLEASAGVHFTAQWRAEALEAMRYAQRLRPPVRIVFRTTR